MSKKTLWTLNLESFYSKPIVATNMTIGHELSSQASVVTSGSGTEFYEGLQNALRTDKRLLP